MKRFINVLNFCHQLAVAQKIEDYQPKVLALFLLIQYRSLSLYRKTILSTKAPFDLLHEDTLKESEISEFEKLPDILREACIRNVKEIEKYIYLTKMVTVTETDDHFRDPKLEEWLALHTDWLSSDVPPNLSSRTM